LGAVKFIFRTNTKNQKTSNSQRAHMMLKL